MKSGHAAHPFNRRCRSADPHCSGIARLRNHPPDLQQDYFTL